MIVSVDETKGHKGGWIDWNIRFRKTAAVTQVTIILAIFINEGKRDRKHFQLYVPGACALVPLVSKIRNNGLKL